MKESPFTNPNASETKTPCAKKNALQNVCHFHALNGAAGRDRHLQHTAKTETAGQPTHSISFFLCFS